MPTRIAVIGGGVTGAIVASQLVAKNKKVTVDVFDQGRSGVGGRTSHRIVPENHDLRFDHGCQFFRADTDEMKSLVDEWMKKGLAQEWKGRFFVVDDDDSGDGSFFGFPSQPPFYVGVGGIRSIARGLLHNHSDAINVLEGRRVSGMERRPAAGVLGAKWTLLGTGGEAAFHDTPEKVAATAAGRVLGENYDGVVLTDISSSFGGWHRASAGVPDSFAKRVHAKTAGARVPLFTAMIAFETPVPIELDAAAITRNDDDDDDDDDDLWFVARSNSKPGLESLTYDCWTLVSTPEYAVRKIQETPMQDPQTGAFIPQDPKYLTTVPGPELEHAFRRILLESKLGTLTGEIPKTVHLNAQRWGSALPAHRCLDRTSSSSSSTRKILSGVAYDSGRAPLAPTRLEKAAAKAGNDELSFVADDEIMLFQAGDFVSSYTPGFESSVLSGLKLAEHIDTILSLNSTQ